MRFPFDQLSIKFIIINIIVVNEDTERCKPRRISCIKTVLKRCVSSRSQTPQEVHITKSKLSVNFKLTPLIFCMYLIFEIKNFLLCIINPLCRLLFFLFQQFLQVRPIVFTVICFDTLCLQHASVETHINYLNLAWAHFTF